MTTDQLKTVILEAVDCLRQRKCRPDRESIAVFVMRKLGSSMNEIFSEIENTVDQGLLLKVEYKGSTSYRSPKNFDLKNSPLLTKHSKILNSSKTTRYIISAMNELLSAFVPYSECGIPYEELKKKLQDVDKERFADEGIKVIFEREEGAGTIQVAQSNDELDPVRIFPKDIKVPEAMKVISFAEEAPPPPERKKKKRVKKEEEGSDNPQTPKSTGNIRKEKQSLVYAVKSDPHKVNEDSAREKEEVKAKVKQISSIGLKVISEKGSKKNSIKPKANSNGLLVKGKSEESSVADATVHTERKPSLALVQVEDETEERNDVSVEPEVDVNLKKAAPKPKLGKRKSDTAMKSPKSTKQKKPKLESSNVEEDAVPLPRTPPRYTYSSKKRAKDEDYEEVDDTLDKIRNKIHKREADELSKASKGISECAYCKQENNPDGEPEDFLKCCSCNATIHPSCISYSDDHAKRLRENTGSNSANATLNWQCFSCKHCGVCEKSLMAKNSPGLKKIKGKLLKKTEQRYVLCDHCDRGYHVKCINANLSLNHASWYCSDCNGSDKVKRDEGNKSSSSSPEKNGPNRKSKGQGAEKKQVKAKGRNVKKKNDNELTPSSETLPLDKSITKNDVKSQNGDTLETNGTSVGSTISILDDDNEKVPDIKGWTPTQVQKYFTEKGLQDEAASLREQEIDGTSLLLLRRADVIFGLNLRLGPALKIYRLVCQLQQHSTASVEDKKGQPANLSTSKQV